MALGEVRRRIRIQSIETAAAMIEGHLEGGACNDELDLDEDEYLILAEENQKLAKKLYSMADKLKK